MVLSDLTVVSDLTIVSKQRSGTSCADPAFEIGGLRRHKHGCPVFARAAGQVCAALALALLWMPAAQAQLTSRDQGEVMSPGDISREVDPYPFDARIAFSAFLRQRLPAQWWAEDPRYEFGGLTVVIHLPEVWHGNPTSALRQFCPPAYSEIWRSVRQIEMRPVYKKVAWAGTICRN